MGIGHARLNNNLTDPTLPSLFRFALALFYFNAATLCLSQGLCLATALTGPEEEGENSNNTEHVALAYNRMKLEIKMRCKSPLGIFLPRLLVRQQRKHINM